MYVTLFKRLQYSRVNNFILKLLFAKELFKKLYKFWDFFMFRFKNKNQTYSVRFFSVTKSNPPIPLQIIIIFKLKTFLIYIYIGKKITLEHQPLANPQQPPPKSGTYYNHPHNQSPNTSSPITPSPHRISLNPTADNNKRNF